MAHKRHPGPLRRVGSRLPADARVSQVSRSRCGCDALRLEPGAARQTAQDQERARAVSPPPWAFRNSSGRWRRSVQARLRRGSGAAPRPRRGRRGTTRSLPPLPMQRTMPLVEVERRPSLGPTASRSRGGQRRTGARRGRGRAHHARGRSARRPRSAAAHSAGERTGGRLRRLGQLERRRPGLSARAPSEDGGDGRRCARRPPGGRCERPAARSSASQRSGRSSPSTAGRRASRRARAGRVGTRPRCSGPCAASSARNALDLRISGWDRVIDLPPVAGVHVAVHSAWSRGL